MSHQQESAGGRPTPELFSVGIVSDANWLHGIAMGLLRIDMVKDRRFGNVHLSRTTFNEHPVFQSELSTLSVHKMNKGRQDAAPRFKASTYLSFTDSYTDREALGYVSDQKAAELRDAIQSHLPGLTVEGEVITPANHIIIEKDGAELRIDLAAPSLDAKTSHRRRMDEIRKESEHPEGKYYAQMQEYLAEIPPHEHTEEEKEWEQVWKGMVIDSIGESCPVDDGKNRLIKVELQAIPGPDIDEIIDSIFGVPLTTPERFREVLEFYVSGYVALVNAFSEVEGIQPPKPRVLLGSAILAK